MADSVVGIGVDLVDVARFRRALARSPRLVDRVFTVREQAECPTGPRGELALAGRWAAKEAVAKVLVDTTGLEWHDCEVLRAERGRPVLVLSGTVAEAARARGIGAWHLSLSHDGAMAVAFVVATSSATS